MEVTEEMVEVEGLALEAVVFRLPEEAVVLLEEIQVEQGPVVLVDLEAPVQPAAALEVMQL
jgi:hypothetical protein